MDKKQRRKLRQALLRELDLLEIKEAGATKAKLKEIDMRRVAIGKKLDKLADERKALVIDEEDEGWGEEKVVKETPWDRQKELCEKNGISQKTFMNRIYRGEDELSAAKKPVRRKGLFTEEQKRIMEENGINYDTAKERISPKRRWSMEDAITTPIGEKPKSKNYNMGIHNKRG